MSCDWARAVVQISKLISHWSVRREAGPGYCPAPAAAVGAARAAAAARGGSGRSTGRAEAESAETMVRANGPAGAPGRRGSSPATCGVGVGGRRGRVRPSPRRGAGGRPGGADADSVPARGRRRAAGPVGGGRPGRAGARVGVAGSGYVTAGGSGGVGTGRPHCPLPLPLRGFFSSRSACLFIRKQIEFRKVRLERSESALELQPRSVVQGVEKVLRGPPCFVLRSLTERDRMRSPVPKAPRAATWVGQAPPRPAVIARPAGDAQRFVLGS